MASTTAASAARTRWAGLAVLALPCLVYAMDLTALTAAVPQLTADLRPTATQLLWINDGYGFLLAGSLLLMGNLGDRIGRRRLLLIGAAAFGALSVVASAARSPEQLIAARCLLGVAGATVAPSTLALIGTLFTDPRQRTTAVAVWITSFSAGGALGPVVAGALLGRFWWGSVLLPAVPVMALLLLTGRALLPEARDPSAGPLDLVGAALSVGAVLSLVAGLKAAVLGGSWERAAVLLLAGVTIAAGFLRRQRGRRDPLLDLGLFRLPALAAALLSYALSMLALAGMFLFTVQYLQLVLGLRPLVAGVWSALDAVALVVCSLATPPAARRIRPGLLVPCGLALAAAGMLVVARAGTGSQPWVIALGNVVAGVGLAPVITLANDLVITAAPPRRSAAAAALSETGAELGGALGIALLGALGSAVYRARVAGPGMAAGARDTLGGALAEAGRLSPGAGAALTRSADAAFTGGLHAVAVLSALLLLAGAAITAVMLRVRPNPDRPPATEPPATEPVPVLSCC